MDQKRKVKIGFTSSSGGHYEQLMMLIPLMDKFDSFILTEKTSYSLNEENHQYYYVSQINRRELTFVLKLVWNTIISFIIFIREQPDIIISTGVLATIPLCFIAKLFRRKIIYIESFAKINSATVTGKLMYKIADQFYVQWDEMLEIYPEAVFKGGIY